MARTQPQWRTQHPHLDADFAVDAFIHLLGDADAMPKECAQRMERYPLPRGVLRFERWLRDFENVLGRSQYSERFNTCSTHEGEAQLVVFIAQGTYMTHIPR